MTPVARDAGTANVFAGSPFALESAVVDRHGADDRRGLESRNASAVAYLSAGRRDAAVELFETCLTDARRLLGPRDPDTLVVEGNLSAAYLMAEQDTAGLDLMTRNAEARAQVMGPEHPATLTAADALATALRLTGRPAEAATAHADVAARRSRVLGPGHPDALLSRAGHALDVADAGDVGRAADLLSGTLVAAEEALGRPHALCTALHGHLADCLAAVRGDPAHDGAEATGDRPPRGMRLQDQIDAATPMLHPGRGRPAGPVF